MDAETQAHLNETLIDFVDRAANLDPSSDELTTAIKNITDFSKIQIIQPDPEPIPDPVPTTVLGKAKVAAEKIWESETFRVLLKAGGAFGGVWFVTRATVKQDHVLERQALGQANQRPI